MIVDPATMDIVGIIDWEYAGWGKLETEFANATAFSSAMRESGLNDAIRDEYNTILEKVAAKQQRQLERQQARAAAEAEQQNQNNIESSASGM